MKKRIAALLLAIVTILSTISMMPVMAATNTVTASAGVAKNVIPMLGIMKTNSLGTSVTRAQFAQMVVNASVYKGTTQWAASTSPYSDVMNDYWAATQIRIAASKNWMVGYLGGQFRPEQGVTLQEAIWAVTGLLGYEKSDFTGSQISGRVGVYYDKDLDVNIAAKDMDKVMTREDCMNLFYNLLKATNKTGVKYGKEVFNCSYIDSTGEVDYLSIADNTLQGPFLVDFKDSDKKESALSRIIPFSINSAAYLYASGNEFIEENTYDNINNGDALYYNSQMKRVWVYGSDMVHDITNSDVSVVYNSASVLAPTGLKVDGSEYTFADTNIACEFSVFGDAMEVINDADMKVNNKVIIIARDNGLGQEVIIGVIVDR